MKLACFGGAALLVVPLAARADNVLGGNPAIPRSTVDSATGVMFFDLNHPVSTAGQARAWRIFAASGSGVGQVELNIYRPSEGGWTFVGASPLVAVAWGQLNEFVLPSPIAVRPGDLIGWWYPQGTTPSVMYDEPAGRTLNNHNWPWDPIVAPHADLPDLFTAQWHGPWDVNPRTYSIQVLGVACPADFNGDGFLDFFDYADYVTCFEESICPPGASADFNGDGFADFFDYGDFVSAFEAGC